MPTPIIAGNTVLESGMVSVRVGTRTYLRATLDDLESEAGQAALRWAYRMEVPPVCLCRNCGIAMHVARTPRGRYCLKRNPGSGVNHHIECPSFSLDDLAGSPSVNAPATDRESSADAPINADLSRLLRKLWRDSRFNCWHPAMTRKRNLHILRRELLATARNLHRGSAALSDCLSIQYPESGQDWSTATSLLVAAIQQGVALTGSHMVLFEVDPACQPGSDRLMQSRWCKGLNYRLPVGPSVAPVRGDTERLFALVEVTGFETDHTAHAAGAGFLLTTTDFLPVQEMSHAIALASLVKDGYRFVVPLRNDATAPGPVAVIAEQECNRYLYCATGEGLTAQSQHADRLKAMPHVSNGSSSSVYLPAAGLWMPSLPDPLPAQHPQLSAP